MRQNRHCQIYWQISQSEKNVMRSAVLHVREHKSPLLLGGKILGLRSSADADRVMYNKCVCGVDSGQKLLMWCGQRAQIFCPLHLYFKQLWDNWPKMSQKKWPKCLSEKNSFAKGNNLMLTRLTPVSGNPVFIFTCSMCRSEMIIGLDLGWTGSGRLRKLLILDWNRIANCPKIFGSEPHLDWVNGKNCIIFVIERLHFLFFGLYLDLNFEFLELLGLCLDLDWVFKIQDWIWIAKYDSPLISGVDVDSRAAWLALLVPKNRNLALLISTWLQNFHLAIWLLFGSFATSSFQKFFMEKSCEWHM